MAVSTFEKTLLEIPVEKIDRNPENPRLFFRQNELDELTDSIRRYGVQVPIAVYKESGRFILIDGERRWRCSLKLNKKTIPAIIQEKPDALTNLMLMFNIHALREQWDLLTIALKLPRVIELYKKKNNYEPNERELSEETGLSRSIIRRSKLLMNLPENHIDLIKAELKKPNSNQRISEDFYIEMERALTTVSRSMPDVLTNPVQIENARQVLLEKYQKGIIQNITDFRKLAKVARASYVEADIEVARKEINNVLSVQAYTIEEAYKKSVSDAYIERDIKTNIESLIEELNSLDRTSIDIALLELLEQLGEVVNKMLRGHM